MNENYYVSYLKSSSSYQNLNKAYEKINTIKTNLKNLKLQLDKGSGDYVKHFDTIIDDLNNRLNHSQEILISQQVILKSNAERFDKVLNEWKSKVGTVYSTNIPNGFISSTTRSFTKTERIVDDVSVSSNGYINIKFKIISYNYYVNSGFLSNSGSYYNWTLTHPYSSKNITYSTQEYNFDGKQI